MKEWLILGAFAAFVLGGIACAVTTSAPYQCYSVRKNTGMATKFSWVSGCYVHVNGQWTPLNAWRVQ